MTREDVIDELAAVLTEVVVGDLEQLLAIYTPEGLALLVANAIDSNTQGE